MKPIKINKIRTYSKAIKDSTETRVMICINDTVHLSLKQITQVGYSNPQSLIGNTIKVEFHKKGDKSFNGTEITQDDTIVKEFEIEATAQDIQLSKASNAGFKVFALTN